MSIEQRNSSVAAEMARIFGGGAASPPENGRGPPLPEQARGDADAPAAASGGALAARRTAMGLLMAFASAFGLLAYQAARPDPPVPAETPASASMARPPEVAAADPDEPADPAPSVPVEPPTAPETVGTSPAQDHPPPGPAVDRPTDERPAPGETQTTGAGGVVASLPAERPPAYDAPPPPPPSPPRPDVTASRPAASGTDCPPGSEEDRCIYQDVLNAHRRLQRAYQRAEFEGVPPAELRAVRRAWNRARDISMDEPDETIRQYDGLADYLRRASR